MIEQIFDQHETVFYYMAIEKPYADKINRRDAGVVELADWKIMVRHCTVVRSHSLRHYHLCQTCYLSGGAVPERAIAIAGRIPMCGNFFEELTLKW